MNDVTNRINRALPTLPPNQKVIAEYILTNPETWTNLTARKLSEKTYTVPSSIIAFSQKLVQRKH